MKLKPLTTVLIFILSANPFSLFAESKILTEQDMKTIEDRVEKELADKKNDPTKKYFINIATAREAYQFRFFDKADHYYSNAIALNVKEDKTEAYINRIAIAIVSKDKKRISDTYNEAKNYFEKNKKLQTKEVTYYLTSIEQSLSSTDPGAAKIQGFYGMYTTDENFKNLLKSKQYEKAFSLLNPEGMKTSEDSLRITSYDTLNVMLNKKNVKELHCNKEFKEFPDAYAYSTLICGLLNDYLKTGTFSANRMKRAETYFKEEAQEKKYLLDMVREIK